MENIVFNENWENGLKRYPDKFFDWAICDVPYGINVGKMSYLTEQKTRTKQKNGKKLNARANKKAYELKEWDKVTPSQNYIDELKRVSKEQIIFGVEYVDWVGLGKGRIKWLKGMPEAMSFKGYEMAYCSSINHTIEMPILWHGMRQAKNLKEPMTQQGNKKLNEKRIHPCQKPRLLYKAILKEFNIFNMSILDTHNGSGSLRIEADLANCDFTGFEIDSEYWQDQENRYLLFKQQYGLWK